MEVVGSDGREVAAVGDEGGAVEVVEGDFIDAVTAGKIMQRGIDVGADMSGRFEHGDVGGIAPGQVTLQGALIGDILGVSDHAGFESERDIVDFPIIFHKTVFFPLRSIRAFRQSI